MGSSSSEDTNASSAVAVLPVKVPLKFPEPPYICAGALGGPTVMLVVTPMRNALTLGTLNQSLGVVGIYQQVFQGGFRSGFAGGISPAIAAVPGFLVLGPVFHVFKDLAQSSSAAVCLTAVCESLIFFGPETRNAQMAYNNSLVPTAAAASSSGSGSGSAVKPTTPAKQPQQMKLTNLQHPLKPWTGGISLGVHVTRNILAMSGLRVFSEPCQKGMAQLWPSLKDSPTNLNIAGDLVANVVVSAFSAPLHQVYGWSVTLRAAAALDPAASKESFVVGAIKFLKKQYLTPSGSISSVAGRDIVLRVALNATIFTMYGFIERSLVQNWSSITGTFTS